MGFLMDLELPVIVKFCRVFDNGFALISAELNPYSNNYSDELEQKASRFLNKKYKSLTITTSSATQEISEGGQYIFIGDFSNHPKYGPQFKSDFHYQDVPATKDGMIIFLKSLPYIKDVRSRAIVNTFGVEGTFDILNNNIYRLTEISGITTQRIPEIKAEWDKKKIMRDIYEFFIAKRLTVKLAEQAFKRWGNGTISVIEKNPYALTELKGVGFLTADTEAHKILDPVPIELRVKACISYVLGESLIKDSNLCIPYKILRDNVVSVLNKCDVSLSIDSHSGVYKKEVPACLKKNLNIFSVVKDTKSDENYVYLKDIWDKECYIASSIYERYSDKNISPRYKNVDTSIADKLISRFLNREMKLDESQKRAIETVFDHKMSIITGGGGTGKSTICKCIVDLAAMKNLSVSLMSPTGKAAQVLSTKTNRGASTIHRALKLKPGNSDTFEIIEQDILIVDEISMCGIDTINAIMRAMNDEGHVVFIGDKNQLPSVSPGNFLSDIINSKCANIVVLDKIHRQSEKSYISILSNMISDGKVVDIPSDAKDIKWVNLNTETFHQDLLRFIDRYRENNDLMDLQIISPMKKGICGVFKINEIMQEKMSFINGHQEDCIQKGFVKFYIGDKVIQTENNYDKNVFNGDMGIIMDLGEKIINPGKDDKKEKFVHVSFYGEEITFVGEEIDQLQLAWCITVHKFQGSQSPYIVFVMASEAQVMMNKELVYTAFTRAEKGLYIYGHKNMLQMAPTKSVVKKRYTNFVNLINQKRDQKQYLRAL